jgi:hypothetical protein
LNEIKTLTSKYHLKNATFAFHDKDSDFFVGLKDVVKEITFLNDRINENSYVVTRRAFPTDAEISYGFHFDNYESTILVPLKVPSSELSGDIVVWENARKKPSNVITHVITKLFFQNPVTYYFLKKLYEKKSKFQKFKRFSLKPGDFLHFDGFVNLHFNLPVGSEERLSLLIHNEKIFEKSFIVKLIEIYSRFTVRAK